MLKQILKTLFLLAIFFMLPSFAKAATLWVNPNGSNTAPYDTKIKGATQLWTAMSAMSAGDTIIIVNGNYKNSGDMMSITSVNGHLPPSGTALDNMTTIQAETDFGVTLPYLSDQGIGRSFVKIQGIIFNSETTGHGVYGWNYSKFIKCGFYSGLYFGNVSPFSLSNSSYNLVEECFSWGGGRYMFLDYKGNHNIFRRNVARMDRYCCSDSCGTWPGQQSAFRVYWSTDTLLQNCIGIDMDRSQNYCLAGSDTGMFWVGDQYAGANNKIEGSIVYKGFSNAYFIGGDETGLNSVSMVDSIAIGPIVAGTYPINAAILDADAAITASNLGFYNINNTGQYTSISIKDGGSLNLVNSIFSNVGNAAFGSFDYSYYFNVGSGSWGYNSINADPMINGQLYPVRVEDGSVLKNTCNGQRCGAEILKKWGVSGTIYGEIGYDLVTSENLWPFPNEDVIKTNFSTTISPVSGIYGFTAGTSMDGSSQTLTKYIWEAFGNQIPCEIYGTCGGDAIPPSAPQGLSVL